MKSLRGRGRGQAPVLTDNLEDLKLRYLEFKYLLRANNEVLNIIAELQAKISQSGAVGLDFLRSRYTMAGVKVYKMIIHLNQISGGAHTDLYPAYQRIMDQINLALSEGHRPEEQEMILRLHEVDRDLAYLVGFKAANLALAGELKVPVRDGFVITTSAFHRLMKTSGLEALVRQELMLVKDDSYRELADLSRKIRTRIMEAEMPPELSEAIGRACGDLFARLSGPQRLALRSSAIGEDSALSFAGQFKTMLNVEPGRVLEAYREVVASLYETQAMAYRHRHGLRDEDAEMAVLVLPMLEPVVSGVMYTRDPRRGVRGPVLINAVYGLGRGLVEGVLDPDTYKVSREPEVKLVKSRLGDRPNRVVAAETGLAEEPVPAELVGRPTLTPGQAEELARLGLALEAGLGGPQDVEWSLLPDGRLVILQTRSLQVYETVDLDTRKERRGRLKGSARRPQAGETSGREALAAEVEAPVILEGGLAARPRAGSGPAHLILREECMADFPEGGVIVALKASPAYACILGKAAAVVTEVGSVTGHMASLTREFGVPTLVGVKNALNLITTGEVITVDATARRIYRGRVEAVLQRQEETRRQSAAAKPREHPAIQLLIPLTLTDPRSPDFRPERCRTFHDIIRFIHEKSFSAMFHLGDRLDQAARDRARKLDHRLPFELWLIDLGGGMVHETKGETPVGSVISLPGQAFLKGLLDPRLRWDQPRPVSVRGMISVFSGSILTPSSDGLERDMGQKAYAILSAEYLNFNSRVGYHFAALDSVCGPIQNDNYISFHFQGGAATNDRRTLRAEMIMLILARRGFEVQQKGDRVHAFIKKFDQVDTARLLEDLGRLILYTRQMDMLTHDRRMIRWLAKAFEEGNFNLDPARENNAPSSGPAP
ncbi:MAG: PEP/pyruvate-binding domain-containing protein [Thermodesulfobacteriota bacterium]